VSVKKSRQDDRHAAETSILVRMTTAERDQIAEAVRIMNERARPDGGRYYMGSFMLAAALRTAEKVIAGRTTHVTGKRST
jgi:hypothetical protein